MQKMIDKLNTTMINKGTRKKRQREINRDEMRMRRVSWLADEAEEWYSARTRRLRSKQTTRGFMGSR